MTKQNEKALLEKSDPNKNLDSGYKAPAVHKAFQLLRTVAQ